MPAFDFCLYAAALLTVLWLRATPADTATDEVATVAENQIEPADDTWIAELDVEQPRPAEYLATWNNQQLRKECSRQGIAWRNAHGKGKHLLKGEMVEALA